MWLHLFRELPKYDPERAKIEAFANVVIHSWVRMEIRKRSYQKREPARRNVSLDTTMVEHGGDETTLGSTMPIDALRGRLFRDTSDDIEGIELREVIDVVLRRMSAQQLRLLADISRIGRKRSQCKHKLSDWAMAQMLAEMRKLFEDAGLGRD